MNRQEHEAHRDGLIRAERFPADGDWRIQYQPVGDEFPNYYLASDENQARDLHKVFVELIRKHGDGGGVGLQRFTIDHWKDQT